MRRSNKLCFVSFFSEKEKTNAKLKMVLNVSLAFIFSIQLSAQIPKLISYQGVLTDNSGVALANGSYNVTIKIFDALTGGTELWSEDHTVNLNNGLFSIALGSNTALNLPFDKPYYVSTTVDNTELLPRTPMTASPYALNASSSGGGNSGTGNPYALDSEEGTKSEVVFVDYRGHIGLGTNPGYFPQAFTYMEALEPSRIGFKADLLYNPSTRMSVGVYGQSSQFTLTEEDDDMAKGIQVSVEGENAYAHTGLYGLAKDGTEGYGLYGTATDNERNTGVFGIAYGSEFDTGVIGIADGGENDVAIRGLNTARGWAGYFAGKAYIGTNNPNADNKFAQLLVEDAGAQIGILGSSTNIAAQFSGGARGLIAEATTQSGYSGQFLGRVDIQDAGTDIAGNKSLSVFTTKNNIGIGIINNSNPAGDQETWSVDGVASGLNGVGARFVGSKLGGRFAGSTGIEAIGVGDYSGVFYGDIKVLQKDQNLPEDIGTIIAPSKVTVIQKNPLWTTEINPAIIRLTSDNTLNPRLEFYYNGGLQNGSISMSDTDMFFGNYKRFRFLNSTGFLIQSNMAGQIDAENAYGLQMSGSNQGLYIRLTGSTNEDNAFIRFADADGVQGTIRGQTSVSDLAGALSIEVSSFVNNLLSPTSWNNLTGSSQSTSASFDPFDTSQNANWSGNTPNASSQLSTANGKTISNFTSQTLTPEFLVEAVQLSVDAVKNAITFGSSFASIFDLEDIFSKGFDLVMSTYNLISFLTFAAESTYGIAYETGSGDYAEWLLRADTAEIITRGDVVGVRAGEISKTFVEAEHFMAISTAPAVIGKMPQPEVARFYEQTAFMGQVPVKVTGRVEKGDYILPSGKGDGLGIAIAPDQMRALDYNRIVGIAWEASDGKKAFKLINVAVGINQNDLSGIVHQMQNVMNEMQLAIQEVNPNYKPQIFETIHPGKTVGTPSFQHYTVAPTHPSQLEGIFDNRNYETKEEAIAAVKQAWKEVAHINIEDHPEMVYMLENQDKMDEIIQVYTKKLEELQKIANSLQGR